EFRERVPASPALRWLAQCGHSPRMKCNNTRGPSASRCLLAKGEKTARLNMPTCAPAAGLPDRPFFLSTSSRTAFFSSSPLARQDWHLGVHLFAVSAHPMPNGLGLTLAQVLEWASRTRESFPCCRSSNRSGPLPRQTIRTHTEAKKWSCL